MFIPYSFAGVVGNGRSLGGADAPPLEAVDPLVGGVDNQIGGVPEPFIKWRPLYASKKMLDYDRCLWGPLYPSLGPTYGSF